MTSPDSSDAPASDSSPNAPGSSALASPLITPRRTLAGVLILVGLVLRIAQIAGLELASSAGDSQALNPVGYALWSGVILLWPDLPHRSRLQAGALAGVGIALLLIAWLVFDARINWLNLPNGNANVVAMLVGVSFIGLIGGLRSKPRPPGQAVTGLRGLLGTLLGVHVLGSILNLSTLFMVGDRLARRGPLTTPQLLALNRGFCSAALWSPFFAAMAVVMGLAPQLSYAQVLGHGLALAFCAGLLSMIEIPRRFDLRHTPGFSLSPRSLFMPVAMAGLVMLFHYQLTPSLPILAIITFLLPAIALMLNLLKGLNWTVTRVSRHSRERLPAMRGEISLFLCAGLLTQGLTALANAATDEGWRLFADFGPAEASLSFAAIVASSLAGLHPIIGISVLASVTGLATETQQTLFAQACLAAWAIGTSVGPISGTNLSLQGRYGVSGGLIMRHNLGYAAVMSGLVVISLWLLG